MVNRNYLVVSYGMGLDSTALLVEMHNRGMRPDLIMFSDLGGEKPETYAYLAIINAWLMTVGFPLITVVSFVPVRASYTTLEGKCLANGVVPSITLNRHQCALVFKRDVQVKFLRAHQPAIDCLEAGGRIINAIGYDNSTADQKRATKSRKFQANVRKQIAERAAEGKGPLADQWQVANCDMTYYLQDWNLERPALAKIIEAAGLPVPVKSACFFCGASTPAEVVELKNNHPDLYARALHIEEQAQAKMINKRGLAMAGWYWKDLADVSDPNDAAAFLKAQGAKVGTGLRP